VIQVENRGESGLRDEDDDEVFNPDGPTFATYSCATFHKDGQMSTIFKAKPNNQASARVIALKVTNPTTMIAPHNSEREARILVEASHESVVQLLEAFWQPGGRYVLVFPFLRQDLENLLRAGVLTKKQSWLVFEALFNALNHVHSKGIIHRDVKPSNILLRSMDGPAYLTDFGIAWSPTDKESEPAASKLTDVGTTCYRPPELLFGCRCYDESLDMWAAGCVVAEMVKDGHHPVFDAGPLGSELGLIKSMFTTLGTPTNGTWPVSLHTYRPGNLLKNACSQHVHTLTGIRFAFKISLHNLGQIYFQEHLQRPLNLPNRPFALRAQSVWMQGR